ncbi:AP2 domain protein [compost metagenome]
MPERVSIDRVDNTKGYVVGNIQWATDEQQARNKGKYKNNKSGVTGVYKHVSRYGKESWIASWYECKGKSRSKSFNIEKYGDELAFFMAKEYREHQIALLNLAGAGYTENHGK